MKIKTGVMTIPGAPLQGVNPLPEFRKHQVRPSNADDSLTEGMRKTLGVSNKVLPYMMQDRYTRDRAAKRGGGETELVLDELAEIVSGREDVCSEVERQELVRELNVFLSALSAKKRAIFLQRYWYAHSVGDIAARWGVKETAVSMTLHRLRRELRQYLTERGFAL